MYAFQEVHTFDGSPCRSSSRVDIIHEETGIRTRYYGYAFPPVPHVYPWVFNDFYSNVKKDRVLMYVNGKKLPMLKENYPTAKVYPSVREACVPCTPYTHPITKKGKTADVVIIDDISTKASHAEYLAKYIYPEWFTLGDCKPATPTVYQPQYYIDNCGFAVPKQEQGNNPMRSYNDTANVAGATATVINAQSDESKQRDYLMHEFDVATNYLDRTPSKMRKLFNLDAPTKPRTSAELIAAFKDGKFTVDQKKVDRNAAYLMTEEHDEDFYGCPYDDNDNVYAGSQYYGITFTDLPVADQKGYEAAMVEYGTLKKNVKRTIIVGTPAEGLAALISLESFAPTSVTVH